jgi:hypothetical protein
MPIRLSALSGAGTLESVPLSGEEQRMTEAQWLATKDPTKLLAEVRRKAGDRKVRLFFCACARLAWDILDDVCRKAVEAAERFADGKLTLPRLRARENAAWTLVPRGEEKGAEVCAIKIAWQSAYHPPEADPATFLRRAGRAMRRRNHRATLVTLLRDVFGNPFRPLTADPSWLSWRDGTVQNLAATIYDEQAFERMPILGDALEEAGCTDGVLLEHCRGPGPHVRGCWALDALLNRGGTS